MDILKAKIYVSYAKPSFKTKAIVNGRSWKNDDVITSERVTNEYDLTAKTKENVRCGPKAL